MIVRSLLLAALIVGCVSSVASAASDVSLAPAKSDADAPPVEDNLAAYRYYATAQADSLVGMTRVLAREIKDGDVDAAQSAYAPAHRYLKRIEPLAGILRALQIRMDARADAYEGKEADPNFSGFHRIEHGLFANRSVADLSDPADRLVKDARELRERMKLLDVEPGVLFAGATRLVQKIADTRLAGDEERYSRTDLWDLEANMDGVHEIVALMQHQLPAREAEAVKRTDIRFAKINDLLAMHKAGCGFKNYDELSKDDKTALRAEVTALAAELSALRATLAMD